MSSPDRETVCPMGELAVALGLHALEPAEDAMVAAHLTDCADCARLVAETEYVGAALGLSLPQATPSADLEQRVLAIAKGGGAAPVVPLAKATRRNKKDAKTVRPLSRVLAAAVAVLLAAASVALGIRVVQLDAQRDQALRQADELSKAIQQVADPSSVEVPLLTDDRRAMAMVLANREKVSLVIAGLPNNRRKDQIYVLWGIDGGTPRAITAFDVTPDEFVLRDVRSVPGTGQFTGYAVSLEPGRRAPDKPTTVMAIGMVES